MNTLTAQMYGLRNGEKCIVHDIEKGNTLYGISRMYAVEVQDIIDENPWSAEGLTIGETLFIPVKYVNSSEAKNSPQLEGNVLEHVVKKKETLYSLSKRYNIDMNDLIESNPGTIKGLKKGMTVYIPTDKIRESSLQVTPAAQDSLLSHLVGTGETLFSISQMYECEIEAIKDVNRGLPDGLKKGERIRIPKYRDGFLPIPPAEEPQEEEEAGFESAPIQEVKLGLMLPFAINDAQEAVAAEAKTVMQMTDISFEFYRGVEMALDHLSEKGVSAQVHVYDVDREVKNVSKVTSSPAFSELDLIIGPLHRSSFVEMAKQAGALSINTVSPFTSNSSILSGNQEASKVTTQPTRLAEYMAKYIYTKHQGDTVILFKSGHEKDVEYYASFRNSWNEISERSDSAHTVLIEFSMDAYDEEKFLALLRKGGTNVIAVPSRERPFVSDLTTKLRASSMSEYEFTVYGLQNWLKFENIDADLKNRFNMRICASKYLDFENPETKDFIAEFYNRYATVPSVEGYALMGYDITNYYLSGLHEHGTAFLEHLDQFKGEGLETGFDFQRVEGGGWENKYCFVLKYADFELMREN